MLPFRLRATYVADENSKPSHIERDTMPSVDVFLIGHGVERTRNAGPIMITIVNSRKSVASCFNSVWNVLFRFFPSLCFWHRSFNRHQPTCPRNSIPAGQSARACTTIGESNPSLSPALCHRRGWYQHCRSCHACPGTVIQLPTGDASARYHRIRLRTIIPRSI